MKDQNFEIVAAAQDIGGETAAGPWYDKAKATYTTLIDAQHAVSSAYQLINVPTGIWIDERGRVVRPAEPAWTTDQSMKFGGKGLATEGQLYVTALRDWVKNGERSPYALSDEEFARRMKPASPAAMEAEASFKLAVWFHENGEGELSTKYFARAQQLNPRRLELLSPAMELFAQGSRPKVAGEVPEDRAALLPQTRHAAGSA